MKVKSLLMTAVMFAMVRQIVVLPLIASGALIITNAQAAEKLKVLKEILVTDLPKFLIPGYLMMVVMMSPYVVLLLVTQIAVPPHQLVKEPSFQIVVRVNAMEP